MASVVHTPVCGLALSYRSNNSYIFLVGRTQWRWAFRFISLSAYWSEFTSVLVGVMFITSFSSQETVTTMFQHSGEFLLPWDAIQLPSTAARIWVQMADPCFMHHDNLQHDALTPSTVQTITGNYWWQQLSLSVCMHLSAFVALIRHKPWNSQTSKTAITMLLLTYRVEHNASVVMQWSQI